MTDIGSNIALDQVMHLQSLIEDLYNCLKVVDPKGNFTQISSALNILKNREVKSFEYVQQKLVAGLRMTYDREADTDELNDIADRIFNLIDQDSTFRKT